MKGIMFKEDLFNAVIDGRKTQTRRVMKGVNGQFHHFDPLYQAVFTSGGVYNSRYRFGETIYLKEPYLPNYFKVPQNGHKTLYRYGHCLLPGGVKFKNKMFMPEKHARHFIKITKVKVELLQDISTDSIKAEGVDLSDCKFEAHKFWKWAKLWDSINKPPHSWSDNPYVWVYEFELADKEN